MYRSRTTIFKNILILISILLIIGYIFTCLVPFVNTGSNWFIALPGVFFPVLFLLLAACMLTLFFMKSGWAWVCLIVLAAGFQQVAAVFSFHAPKEFSLKKAANTLRVFQWNVMGWDQSNEINNIQSGGHALRPQMMYAIQAAEADILCLEEFYEPRDTLGGGSNITAIQSMGFPYYYFVPAKSMRNDSTSGVAIFSKYPFQNKGSNELDRYPRGDHLLYTDVQVQNQVFRVMATHLIPVKFSEWEEEKEEYRSTGYGELFGQMVKGFQYRYYQAKLVQQKINESPYPVILCGDFNDFPNSSVYFNMKGQLQDAFLKKGSGFGRTTTRSFYFIYPRIDYILAQKSFKVLQYHSYQEAFSDHYPIVADLQF